MSDEKDQDAQPATDTSRRRFLAGAAALGIGAATLNAFAGSELERPANDLPLLGDELDKQLHEKTCLLFYVSLARKNAANEIFYKI